MSSGAGEGHLTRHLAPSFSGWSDQLLHPHPPGDLSSGGSHHQHHPHHHQQQQQQEQPPSLQGAMFQHAVEAAAAAAAAHCSLFAAGGLQQQRVRRKSTSDAAPHHVPGSLATRRRKSDGGLRGSAFAPHLPLFLAGLAATADSGSQPSSTGSSSPGVSVSLDTEHTTYLGPDTYSAGAASSQHHQLTPITEGAPLTELEVTPPASPGMTGARVQQQQRHEQQCQQQQQQLQQELLQLQQMAQQKQAELELLQQQQLSECLRSPTPPSYGSGLPNICVSPRGATMYRPLGSGSTPTGGSGGSARGGGSRRAATEPLPSHSGSAASNSGGQSHGSGSSSHSCGYSPGASAIVLTNSSSSMGRQSQQQRQPQQAQLDAAAAAAAAAVSPSAAGGRVQPVARDITQRLQMQRTTSGDTMRQLPAAAAAAAGPGAAADLEHSSIWGSWSGHGLAGSSAAQASLQAFEQQERGQLQPAAVHNGAPSSEQQRPGPAAAGDRPRAAPQRSRSSSNMAKSPAPPPVPPSPQQHAVAELRNRRSSCSSTPALPSGMLAPSPRPVLSYGEWGHSAAHVAGGQTGERRAGSSSGSSALDAPKLTVRVISPETESLWSAYYAGGQSSPRSAYDEVQASSGGGLTPVPEQQEQQEQQQQDARGSTGFLSMQEQRLAHRNEARGMLVAEGSGRETPGSGSSIRGGLSDTSHKVLLGQSSGLHKAGAGAALPPPHPPLSQQSDVPGTPRGHMTLNPQHTAPRSASAAASGLAPLHQPQHPVPPRQHAPSCRSPCVSSRQHVAQISPAAAAWLGNNSALTGQHSSCSPILEQGPYGNPGSNPSSAGSCRAAGSYSRASPVAGGTALLQEGGTLSSSGSTAGLGPTGRLGGSASAAATPGSGSGASSSARVNLPGALPRPAFDQLARSVSLDASYLQQQQVQQQQQQQQHVQQQQQQHPILRSPSPPAAPDATATIYGCGRPMRACSPLVKKVAAGLNSAGSSSGSQQADEQQQQRLQRLQVPKSPSPPPMGAAAMIAASPRVGAHAVQPCPPVNSLPPVSPSPSVRTRLLGQQHTSSQGTPDHHAPPAQVPHAASDAAAAEAGKRAVRMLPSEPEWAGSSPVLHAPPAAAKSLTFSTTAGAAAAAPAESGSGAQGSAATLSRPGRLLQPQLPALPAARGDGTPDMAWMQPAGAVRASAVPGGVLDRAAPQSGSDKRPAAAAAALSTAAKAGSAAAGSQEPVSWASAAVVAFCHYRGRLGYLMNSGVVGVLMEDASMMLVQPEGGDMRTVCYIQPPASTAAATAAAGEGPVSSNDAPPAGRDTRQVPALAHGRSRAASTDTDVGQSDQATSGQGMDAAAAAAGHGSAKQQGPPAGTQLFRLPEPLAGATHGASSSPASSSRVATGSSVPEHLASKVRCVQRFVGCLVHHQPYSSKRHLDVTRLVLPGPWGLQQRQQQPLQQRSGAQQGLQRQLDSSWVHVQHFNNSEGCVLLTLTDGSQQLVFTSDSSVLLLQPSMQQLAYVTPPRRRQRQASRPGGASSPADGAADAAAVLSCSDSEDSDNDSGGDAPRSGPGAPELVVLKLGAGGVDTAGLQDPRLLARLKQASCLPGVLPFEVCLG